MLLTLMMNVGMFGAEPAASATPGFRLNLHGLAAVYRGRQPDEEEKLKRWASYFPDKPAVTPSVAERTAEVYSQKSAKLAAAISRLHVESAQIRQRIAELESQIQSQIEAKEAGERARLEYRLLLANQALLLAQVQEAVLIEEMEAVDVAFMALFALTMTMQ